MIVTVISLLVATTAAAKKSGKHHKPPGKSVALNTFDVHESLDEQGESAMVN